MDWSHHNKPKQPPIVEGKKQQKGEVSTKSKGKGERPIATDSEEDSRAAKAHRFNKTGQSFASPRQLIVKLKISPAALVAAVGPQAAPNAIMTEHSPGHFADDAQNRDHNTGVSTNMTDIQLAHTSRARSENNVVPSEPANLHTRDANDIASPHDSVAEASHTPPPPSMIDTSHEEEMAKATRIGTTAADAFDLTKIDDETGTPADISVQDRAGCWAPINWGDVPSRSSAANLFSNSRTPDSSYLATDRNRSSGTFTEATPVSNDGNDTLSSFASAFSDRDIVQATNRVLIELTAGNGSGRVPVGVNSGASLQEVFAEVQTRVGYQVNGRTIHTLALRPLTSPTAEPFIVQIDNAVSWISCMRRFAVGDEEAYLVGEIRA